VKPGTVSNYLAVVRNLHLECVMNNPTTRSSYSILKGVKRAHSTATSAMRLSFTISLLRELADQARREDALPLRDRKMYQAAILLGFHGFLRCGEFTADPQCPKAQPTPTRSGISFHYVNGKSALQIHVRWSKTDPFAKGMVVHTGTTSAPHCPVVAMLEYLAPVPAEGSRQLFQNCHDLPLSKARLTDRIWWPGSRIPIL